MMKFFAIFVLVCWMQLFVHARLRRQPILNRDAPSKDHAPISYAMLQKYAFQEREHIQSVHAMDPEAEARRTELLSKSNTPKTASFPHSAYGDIAGQMILQYFTPHSSKSACDYGTSASKLDMHATGNSTMWGKGYGYYHVVYVNSLSLSTTYYYRCGTGDAMGYTPTAQFQIAAPQSKATSFLMFGDMGIYYSQNTTEQLKKHVESVDYVLHVGDISYADDHLVYFQETWMTFLENLAPVMQKVAYMTTPGNHEFVSLDPLLVTDTINFEVYNQVFRMPTKDVGNLQNRAMFYSFDSGLAHVVVVSSESSFPGQPFWFLESEDYFGNQLEWLAADFAKADANRAQTPWIIVAYHRPIYSSSRHYSANGVPVDDCFVCNSATMQKVFEPLFVQHKVDLVLNGHTHNYERTWPVNNSTVTAQSKTTYSGSRHRERIL